MKDGDTEKVVAYYSKSLSRPERNYCVTRRELLAVVKAVKQFHVYLYGRPFTVRTDHASLQWLMNFKEPEGQICRWLQFLQQYNFTLKYRVGKSHGNADGLSRRPCCKDGCRNCSRLEEKESKKIESYAVKLLPDVDIAAEQKKDGAMKLLITALEEKRERPGLEDMQPVSRFLRVLWEQWKSLELVGGVLCRCRETDVGVKVYQVILPRSMRQCVLELLHSNRSCGHFGGPRTFERVRERFYWPGYHRDVLEWCSRCVECFKKTGPARKTKPKMKMSVSGEPGRRIAMDILGPLPTSDRGNKYVLVVADYFTKWTEAFPMKNQEASTVATIFVEEWVSRYGVPAVLHSDQGRNFESSLFRQVCELLGIQKTRTSPLHPQSDGMVERFNRTLLNAVAKMVDANQRDWDEQLPLVMMAYRSSRHDSTKFSPNYLQFGREVRLPADIVVPPPPGRQSSSLEYVGRLQEKLADAHELARRNLYLTGVGMSKCYDRTVKEEELHPGSMVWLYNPVRKKGFSPKLQSFWQGPYSVVRVVNDQLCEVQVKGKKKIIHRKRLARSRGSQQEVEGVGTPP